MTHRRAFVAPVAFALALFLFGEMFAQPLDRLVLGAAYGLRRDAQLLGHLGRIQVLIEEKMNHEALSRGKHPGGHS